MQISPNPKILLNSTLLKSMDQLKEYPISDVKVISDGGSAVHCVSTVELLVPDSVREEPTILEFGDGRTLETKYCGTLLLKTPSGNVHLKNTIVIPGCPCIIISEPLFDLAGVMINKGNGKISFTRDTDGEVVMSGRLTRNKQYEMAVQPVRVQSVKTIAHNGNSSPEKDLSFCESLIWPIGSIVDYGWSRAQRLLTMSSKETEFADVHF